MSNHHGEQLLVCVSPQATIVSILLKLATVLKVEASRDLALFEVLDSLSIGECRDCKCLRRDRLQYCATLLPICLRFICVRKFERILSLI